MNFFESQDRDERKTTQLIFLFALAVISLVLLTNLLILGFATLMSQGGAVAVDWRSALQSVGWETLVASSLGVVTVVSGASLYKVATLSGGGARVAQSLNGRLVNTNTADLSERKVLNVVEEMAIAAGMPVPPVYIIDEDGINAFAAGFQAEDAVIGVTRGCIRLLTRDELQGVIAHEFSHIMHGDMRINIRLMGTVYGIMVIGMMGYFIMRSFARSNFSRSSGRDNQGALPFVLLGVGLMVIGYAGTFFGNLIKASVSRQREFLADASAVQYTRYPEGIAGALKKIGAVSMGSRINHPKADEVSHMFFGQAVRVAFNSFLATHPPLPKRIKAIDPRWNGKFPKLDIEATIAQVKASGAAGFAEATTPSAAMESTLESVGQVDDEHLQYARAFLGSISPAIVAAAHERAGAKAIVYALLIDKDDELGDKQNKLVMQDEDEATITVLPNLLPEIKALNIEHRLPLIDLCIPTLKSLYKDQYVVFRRTVLALMRADDEIDLFEWCLHRLLVRHIDTAHKRVRHHRIRHRSLKAVEKESRVLLAALAFEGAEDAHDSATAAQSAFNKGLEEIGLGTDKIPAAKTLSLRDIDAALAELSELAPLQKPRLIKACAQCVLADDQVVPREYELLRAIADSLDVPLPPRLAQQRVI